MCVGVLQFFAPVLSLQQLPPAPILSKVLNLFAALNQAKMAMIILSGHENYENLYLTLADCTACSQYGYMLCHLCHIRDRLMTLLEK